MTATPGSPMIPPALQTAIAAPSVAGAAGDSAEHSPPSLRPLLAPLPSVILDAPSVTSAPGVPAEASAAAPIRMSTSGGPTEQQPQSSNARPLTLSDGDPGYGHRFAAGGNMPAPPPIAVPAAAVGAGSASLQSDPASALATTSDGAQGSSGSPGIRRAAPSPLSTGSRGFSSPSRPSAAGPSFRAGGGAVGGSTLFAESSSSGQPRSPNVVTVATAQEAASAARAQPHTVVVIDKGAPTPLSGAGPTAPASPGAASPQPVTPSRRVWPTQPEAPREGTSPTLGQRRMSAQGDAFPAPLPPPAAAVEPGAQRMGALEAKERELDRRREATPLDLRPWRAHHGPLSGLTQWVVDTKCRLWCGGRQCVFEDYDGFAERQHRALARHELRERRRAAGEAERQRQETRDVKEQRRKDAMQRAELLQKEAREAKAKEAAKANDGGAASRPTTPPPRRSPSRSPRRGTVTPSQFASEGMLSFEDGPRDAEDSRGDEDGKVFKLGIAPPMEGPALDRLLLRPVAIDGLVSHWVEPTYGRHAPNDVLDRPGRAPTVRHGRRDPRPFPGPGASERTTAGVGGDTLSQAQTAGGDGGRVGGRVVLSCRPASSGFLRYRLVEQLHTHHVTAVFNLQVKGEHPFCGLDSGAQAEGAGADERKDVAWPGGAPLKGQGKGSGLLASSGFTYDGPVDLMRFGITYHEFPMDPSQPPPLELLLRIAQAVAAITDKTTAGQGSAASMRPAGRGVSLGQGASIGLHATATDGPCSVLLHCHTGFGRSGLVAACHLMFSHRMPWRRAAYAVQQSRPGALSAQWHHDTCERFSVFLTDLAFAMPRAPADLRVRCLEDYLFRQAVLLHDDTVRAYRFAPRFVHVALWRVLKVAACGGPMVASLALECFAPSTAPASDAEAQRYIAALNTPNGGADECSVVSVPTLCHVVLEWFRRLDEPLLDAVDVATMLEAMRAPPELRHAVIATACAVLPQSVQHTVGLLLSAIAVLAAIASATAPQPPPVFKSSRGSPGESRKGRLKERGPPVGVAGQLAAVFRPERPPRRRRPHRDSVRRPSGADPMKHSRSQRRATSAGRSRTPEALDRTAKKAASPPQGHGSVRKQSRSRSSAAPAPQPSKGGDEAHAPLRRVQSGRGQLSPDLERLLGDQTAYVSWLTAQAVANVADAVAHCASAALGARSHDGLATSGVLSADASELSLLAPMDWSLSDRRPPHGPRAHGGGEPCGQPFTVPRLLLTSAERATLAGALSEWQHAVGDLYFHRAAAVEWLDVTRLDERRRVTDARLWLMERQRWAPASPPLAPAAPATTADESPRVAGITPTSPSPLPREVTAQMTSPGDLVDLPQVGGLSARAQQEPRVGFNEGPRSGPGLGSRPLLASASTSTLRGSAGAAAPVDRYRQLLRLGMDGDGVAVLARQCSLFDVAGDAAILDEWGPPSPPPGSRSGGSDASSPERRGTSPAKGSPARQAASRDAAAAAADLGRSKGTKQERKQSVRAARRKSKRMSNSTTSQRQQDTVRKKSTSRKKSMSSRRKSKSKPQEVNDDAGGPLDAPTGQAASDKTEAPSKPGVRGFMARARQRVFGEGSPTDTKASDPKTNTQSTSYTPGASGKTQALGRSATAGETTDGSVKAARRAPAVPQHRSPSKRAANQRGIAFPQGQPAAPTVDRLRAVSAFAERSPAATVTMTTPEPRPPRTALDRSTVRQRRASRAARREEQRYLARSASRAMSTVRLPGDTTSTSSSGTSWTSSSSYDSDSYSSSDSDDTDSDETSSHTTDSQSSSDDGSDSSSGSGSDETMKESAVARPRDSDDAATTSSWSTSPASSTSTSSVRRLAQGAYDDDDDPVEHAHRQRQQSTRTENMLAEFKFPTSARGTRTSHFIAGMANAGNVGASAAAASPMVQAPAEQPPAPSVAIPASPAAGAGARVAPPLPGHRMAGGVPVNPPPTPVVAAPPRAVAVPLSQPLERAA